MLSSVEKVLGSIPSFSIPFSLVCDRQLFKIDFSCLLDDILSVRILVSMASEQFAFRKTLFFLGGAFSKTRA
jgi:hypothetical protein